MHVAIDLLNLLPGKSGGVETYWMNLLHNLQTIDDCNRYTLLTNVQNAGYHIATNNFSQVTPFASSRIARLIRMVFGFDFMRHTIGKLKPDLVHYPFTVAEAHVDVPVVLTFHDMQEEFLPTMFSARELAWRRRVHRVSADRASRIIAISQHVKASLIHRYGISAEKIEVIYQSCGPAFQVIDDSDVLRSAAARYRLDRPFLFYPAATWPHKNHSALFRAVRELMDSTSFDGILVLTGVPIRPPAALEAEIHELRLTKAVRMLGYVPASELPAIYNLATLLIFPSLFEGFGIPLVEAMACGCPIVSSSAASLPEVAESAAVFFDPASPHQMAEAIWRVWRDSKEQARLRRLGFHRFRAFSWRLAAERTLGVYESVAHG